MYYIILILLNVAGLSALIAVASGKHSGLGKRGLQFPDGHCLVFHASLLKLDCYRSPKEDPAIYSNYLYGVHGHRISPIWCTRETLPEPKTLDTTQCCQHKYA